MFHTGSLAVSKLFFYAGSRELIVVLQDSSFQKFQVSTGQLVTHVRTQPLNAYQNINMDLHSQANVNDSSIGGPGSVEDVAVSGSLSPSGDYLLIGNSRSTIRVFSYDSSTPAMPIYQTYLAHQHGNGVQGNTNIHYHISHNYIVIAIIHTA